MKKYLILLTIFLCGGCATVDGPGEALKKIWGSSTKSLEDARAEAIAKTYYSPYWDVIKGAKQVVVKKGYQLFKEDEVKGYFVLMGIKGSVNTTEVGVFFVEENDHQTRVEISSLSSNAKRIVSRNLFHGLDIVFGLVPPDPEPEIIPSDTDQRK